MKSPFSLMIAKKLKNRTSRHNFFAGRLLDELAMSIRDLREQRNLTQDDLAKLIGMNQSAISRMEQATYGKWGIPTLLRVAEGLDARIEVRFVPMEEVIEGYMEIKKETGNTQEIPFYDLPLSLMTKFSFAGNEKIIEPLGVL